MSLISKGILKCIVNYAITTISGFYVSGENDSAVIPNRTYDVYSKPPWLTLKYHLLGAHMPGNFFKAISETPLGDKQDEFKKEG